MLALKVKKGLCMGVIPRSPLRRARRSCLYSPFWCRHSDFWQYMRSSFEFLWMSGFFEVRNVLSWWQSKADLHISIYVPFIVLELTKVWTGCSFFPFTYLHPFGEHFMALSFGSVFISLQGHRPWSHESRSSCQSSARFAQSFDGLNEIPTRTTKEIDLLSSWN